MSSRTLNRRELLAVAACATLAGCLGNGDETAETDDRGVGDDDPEGDDRNGEDGSSGDDRNGTDIALEPDELETRAETFVTILADGEFESAEDRVDPAVSQELSAQVLEQAWNDVVVPMGELVEFVTAEFEGIEEGIARVTARAEFTEGVQTFELAYTEQGVAGFFITESTWTPPPYVDESAFVEEDLELEAPGTCSLGATLTVPDDAENGGEGVPGVVIVHGNGPIDRDSTIGPNRPYRELAWGLATEGVAVLRYDKRTFACDVDLADVTVDDVTTDDALTALDALHDDERVDRVFVAGHSFGGLLAPRIATRDGDLSGVVMLAPGPARPMADAIHAQQEHLLSLDDSLTEAERETLLTEVEAMVGQIRTLDIANDEVVNGLGGREYYESLQDYDHTGTASDLDKPVFLAQGGRDWQVTVDEDLPVWKDALATIDSEIVVYDDHNHHFQVSEGEMTPQEYRDPAAFVAEELVEDVAGFVHRN